MNVEDRVKAVNGEERQNLKVESTSGGAKRKEKINEEIEVNDKLTVNLEQQRINKGMSLSYDAPTLKNRNHVACIQMNKFELKREKWRNAIIVCGRSAKIQILKNFN